MPTSLEDLRVLQIAESIADDVWKLVVTWERFERDVVGGQLARAIDSVGANIAEGFGRFHYGDKLVFLYYARGSLFEAKYWLNRARVRHLIPTDQARDMSSRLTDLARQLNAFASSLKRQRQDDAPIQKSKRVREAVEHYSFEGTPELDESLFTETELTWLSSI